MTESKWIYFEEMNDTGKTKVFGVFTKEGNIALGEIKWFGRWRCYSFFPFVDTVFEKTCLQDIVNFITELMEQRKNAKNNRNN